MKKWILVVCFFMLVLAVSFYILIPTQNFNNQITVNCTESAIIRKIADQKKWLWWPGNKINDSIYSFKDYNYKIEKILLNGINTTVFNDKDSVKGFLQLTYYGNDSTQFQWIAEYFFSANPFKRFVQYFQFKKVINNVAFLLADIKKYFDKPENIYGMKIVKQKVTESSMISLKNTFQHYPSTQEIYKMIELLKEYIQKEGGKESNFPMLHVQKEDPMIYETMVAIPTKSDLPSSGKFLLKKMVLGNILMAEVKGGIYTVIKMEDELTNYVNDYKKLSPAIPFQSLVTDRLLETDTTKWITKLYYPIFN